MKLTRKGHNIPLLVLPRDPEHLNPSHKLGASPFPSIEIQGSCQKLYFDTVFLLVTLFLGRQFGGARELAFVTTVVVTGFARRRTRWRQQGW